jgi:hypothetical protein
MEALDDLALLQEQGKTILQIDLSAVSKSAFDDGGPAYRLLDAMLSVHEHEALDGFRGAPRIMLALLVRLAALSSVQKQGGGSKMLKVKREGTELPFRTFVGSDGTTYLVFRSSDGAFHVFAEVEAKQAARECGAEELANTRQMWESLWNK